jgi:hypothetical protein
MRGSTGFIFSLVAGIDLFLTSAMANATTPPPNPSQKRICLRGDIALYVDRATGDHLTGTTTPLLGARMRVKWFDGVNTVSTGWQYADPDDGCLLINTSNGNTYTINYRPYSKVLAGPDELYIRQSNSNLPTYSFSVYLAPGASTHNVTGPSKATVRIYAAMAHAIQSFPAATSDFRITAWNNWNGMGSQCLTPNDQGKTATRSTGCGGDININIAGDQFSGTHNFRKFVIAHEYGHANLNGITAPNDTSCAPPNCVGGVGGPGGHRMRSEEYASGAAMEGWGHFVAADVFSDHGDVESLLQYQDDGILDFSGGGSGCPPAASMPIFENDSTTYEDFDQDRFYITCTPGTTLESAYGVELDWARFWWQYHESTSIAGTPIPHATLHFLLAFLGGWSTIDIYSKMQTIWGGARLSDAGEESGICSGSGC